MKANTALDVVTVAERLAREGRIGRHEPSALQREVERHSEVAGHLDEVGVLQDLRRHDLEEDVLQGEHGAVVVECHRPV